VQTTETLQPIEIKIRIRDIGMLRKLLDRLEETRKEHPYIKVTIEIQ